MSPSRTLAALAFAALSAAPAGAVTVDEATHSIAGIRDARYCEIIPVVRSGFHFLATVYNTLGLNDCPAALWDKITEAEMKKQFGAVKVLLNVPRHFLMDKIIAEGNVHQIRDLIDTHPHTVHIRAEDPRGLAREFLTRADVISMRFEPGAVVIETGQPDAFYSSLTELVAAGQYGTIDEVTSPDDNLQAVFKYLVKEVGH